MIPMDLREARAQGFKSSSGSKTSSPSAETDISSSSGSSTPHTPASLQDELSAALRRRNRSIEAVIAASGSPPNNSSPPGTSSSPASTSTGSSGTRKKSKWQIEIGQGPGLRPRIQPEPEKQSSPPSRQPFAFTTPPSVEDKTKKKEEKKQKKQKKPVFEERDSTKEALPKIVIVASSPERSESSRDVDDIDIQLNIGREPSPPPYSEEEEEVVHHGRRPDIDSTAPVEAAEMGGNPSTSLGTQSEAPPQRRTPKSSPTSEEVKKSKTTSSPPIKNRKRNSTNNTPTKCDGNHSCTVTCNCEKDFSEKLEDMGCGPGETIVRTVVYYIVTLLGIFLIWTALARVEMLLRLSAIRLDDV